MKLKTTPRPHTTPKAPEQAPPRPPSSISAIQKLDTGGAIANLLVKEGHIASEQLAYAKRVQSKLATPTTLLNVLKELRLLTDEQLRLTLRANHTSVRLGDLLVELGYIRAAELQAALNIQKNAKIRKKIGEILTEGQFIDERQLAEILAYQLGFAYVEPDFSELDKQLLARGSLKEYKHHNFIPVSQRDGKIVVAFSNPLDRWARDAASNLLGPDVLPVCITQKALQDAITAYEWGLNQKQTVVTDENAIVDVVNKVLLDALRENASDIHFEPMKDRLRVRFRCDGSLVRYKDFQLSLAPAITSCIKVLASADIAEKRRHQDGRIMFEDQQNGFTIDVRASIYVTIHGEKIVLRLLSKKGELLNLKEIGMTPRILERFRNDALDVPSGVVIITGPTGSGKTTTLYSSINYLNNPHTSIITAEDPVEYVIDSITQCSINPKLNVTFEETLRHILRQDPDVIVLGEIRDRFSAETAIQVALTGHKVLTTFHTEDSIGALLRLLHMDIEAFLISSTVVCVVAQRLLRRVCSNCAEPYRPTATDLRRLGYTSETLRGAHFQVGRGCPQCRFSGYRGRTSIFELLVLNEPVKDAIASRKTSHEIRRISLETSGLVTLLEDGIVKAAQGETTLQEVLHHLPRVHHPRPISQLQRLLGR